MSERWAPVPGFEDIYEISDRGRVESLTRYVRYPDGRKPRLQPGRILKPGHAKGYPYVNLRKDGLTRQIRIHTLVLLAFIGPQPSPRHECNHIDGNRSNNSYWNLEWATRSENLAHKVNVLESGHPPVWRGEDNAMTSLSEKEVIALRHEYARGAISQKALGEKYGISQASVWHIVTGDTWGHVGGPITRRGKGYAAGGYQKG